MQKIFEATVVLDGVFSSEDDARKNLAGHLAAGGIPVDPASIQIKDVTNSAGAAE